MPSDDQNNQSESTRKHLLEEIRRRAEEAELSRLEEEDRSRSGGDKSPREKQPSPTPFPVPASENPAASNRAATEQKVLVLRERLQSALERGKAEKASELFVELNKLIPDDPDLAQQKTRLIALQEEKAKTRIISAAPSAPRVRETGDEKNEREVRRKKIGDMLEAANSYYQQEKYDKAAQYVAQVLNLDPTHAEAANLRAQIEKARQLAEQIQMEEEMRRHEERASGAPRIIPEEPVRTSGRPTDFWGASISGPRLEPGYDLLPEEKGPVGPPPPSFGKRIAERVSSVEIPVKPLITIAVIIILAVAVWYIVDAIRNTVSPARYSILVLPASTSGDTLLSVIADGFAEDLIADLAQVSEIRVIAPATSFAFGASTAPPRQIARALGANYVYSWSMTRVQDKIVVQVSFSDTMGGTAIWSTRVQLSPRELPGLKPELLRGLAGGMGIKLTTNNGSSLLGVSTNNEAAYELYARGRSLLRRSDLFAPEDAIALFDQALRLDTEFGEAYAASAWAHMLAYETSAEMLPAHIAQALNAVQKALSTGLRSPETFRAWGLAEEFRGQYDKAIERFEQAVNAAPSDAEAQRRLAVAYAATGKLDLAVKAAQRSVSDDPGSLAALTLLGQLHQFKAIHAQEKRDDNRAALHAYEQGLRMARDKSEYATGFYADVLVQLQQSDRALNLFLDRVARERESYIDYYKAGRSNRRGDPSRNGGNRSSAPATSSRHTSSLNPTTPSPRPTLPSSTHGSARSRRRLHRSRAPSNWLPGISTCST